MKKIKSLLTMVLALGFIAVFAVWGIAEPDKTESLTERRLLANFPTLSLETISDGSFMTGFEKYMLDHFPLRDSFRTLKAYTVSGVFNQKDNNGLYTAGEHIAKLDFPEKTQSAEYAASRFEAVYDKYFAGTDSKIYLSVIPDKNYFLASQNGYPDMNYEKLINTLKNGFTHAKYIDITGTLTAEDYYYTDSHWRQECLADTAKTLAAGMGVTLTEGYEKKDASCPFYGVYYGQSALVRKPEKLYYLENETIRGLKAYDYESSSEIPVYDLEAASGRDPYEIFLGGAKSVITVENPKASEKKELVIFRDSFTSSIAPLLAEGYSKITLVDIRYISVANVGKIVDFTSTCDVLFLYSTSVINNSETIK